MIGRMPSPVKHRTTGVYWYRKAVPPELRQAVGKWEIKRTLGTKDLREAKRRYPAVAEEAERQLAIAAGTVQPIRLSPRQIVALAGEWYRTTLEHHETAPGSVQDYETMLDAANVAHGEGRVAAFIRPYLDKLLAAQGLVLDDFSRRELSDRLLWEAVEAWNTLARHAMGDYSPDPHLAAMPAWEPPEQARTPTTPTKLAKKAGVVSFTSLLEGYARESGSQPETVRVYRRMLGNLARVVGHDNALLITRSDMIRFKEALLAEGKAPYTVQLEIRGCGAIFSWAVANERGLSENPALKVTVAALRAEKRRGEDRKRFPYTEEEAAAILKAARQESAPGLRWLPWLCWATGARIGEVSQLCVEDVEEREGRWYIAIGLNGERVKNAASRRRAPLHPALIAEGFLDYVKAVKSGRLFQPTKAGNFKQVDNRVSKWVREVVGITDKSKGPSHSWRHYFESQGQAQDISKEMRDALIGHKNHTIGDRYGMGDRVYSHPELLRRMSDAIARYPLPAGL